MKELYPLIVYGEKDPFLKYGYALEAAQMALKFGVTTIRDTFGPLPNCSPSATPSRAVSSSGRAAGAGDILGWSGGMYCAPTPRLPSTDVVRLLSGHSSRRRRVDAALSGLRPQIINRYLDLGVDFIKFGETTEGPVALRISSSLPGYNGQSSKRRTSAGSRSTSISSSAEGHLLAAEAGVDLITHTGLLSQDCPMSGPSARDRGSSVALHEWSTGPMRKWLEAQASLRRRRIARWSPNWEAGVANRQRRQPGRLSGVFGGQRVSARCERPALQRCQAIRKCTIAWDGCRADAVPEITGRSNVPGFVNPDGRSTPIPGSAHPRDRGLVELGMTPGEAIVAATATGNGYRKIRDLVPSRSGIADLLVLGPIRWPTSATSGSSI